MTPRFDDGGAFSLLEKRYPTVPRETWNMYQRYVDLVFEWNSKTNLTGAETPRDFILQHLADCIGSSHIPCLAQNCLDVGTGAGLPGLVWAIMDPARQYFLLDASLKRCAFLRRVQSEFSLSNVKIYSQRFETLHQLPIEGPPGKSSLEIVSRGTSAPNEILELAKQTPLEWEVWNVFSNQKIHAEYLTLAPLFGVEVNAINYQRNVEGFTGVDGLLSQIRRI